MGGNINYHSDGSKVAKKKYPAAHIPVSLLAIGEFKVKPKILESDLVAKCYYTSRKFAWEILNRGTSCKYKIDVYWDNIVTMRLSASSQTFQHYFEIELGNEPKFYREIPKSRGRSGWELVEDFTGSHALKYRRHYLVFPDGVINHHYQRMIQFDSQLLRVSQQRFPSLDSPFFHHLQQQLHQQVPQLHKTTMLKSMTHFPAYLLAIGEFKVVSAFESSDLVAKCCNATRKLIWEIFDKDTNGKYKIDVAWENISTIRVTKEISMPGFLQIELRRQPIFYQETDPRPGCNRTWELCSDFTGGHASTCRRHELVFPVGVLNKLYESLLHFERRFLPLTQQLPCLEISMFDFNSLNNPPMDYSHGINKHQSVASVAQQSEQFKNTNQTLAAEEGVISMKTKCTLS